MMLLALALCAAGQAPEGMGHETVNLGLIPTPQKVELAPGGRVCVLSKAKVKVTRCKWGRGEDVPSFDGNWSQAYRIIVKPRKVVIFYEGEEGYQYALMTLAQLRRLHDTLPCMTITDWPAYRLRGWMDDISRGPVPHEAFRTKQWELLHSLKFNFCNYYTEHTLYQREFPDLAPAYAACRPHPDEVINLQLFAHAEKTLRVPFYQHLMDGRANFNPAVEATYGFLGKRIKGACERIPASPFFIINCDETEQLGTGRAKRMVEALGGDQVYVNHVNRCYELVKEAADARVVMWGDIVAKNPAMMRQLPKDMTYIMWAYEPLASYDHLIRPFADNGSPFWVAPSLSHSSNMIPNPRRYMMNIANLARDGYRNGAEGLMNTCWDDNGEALFDNCWHGLFWSAEMAWNPIRTDNPEEMARRERQFNENFARLFFGREAMEDVNTLYEVGALEDRPAVSDWYTSAALLEPLLNFNPENTHDTALVARVKAVEDLLATIRVDSAANPHAHYALHRIKATAQKAMLRYVVYHARERYEPYAEAYLATLFDLKREYLRLWDQENGEYERYVVLNRYDDLAREVLELDRHVFVEVSCDASGTTGGMPMVTLGTLGGNKKIYYTLDGSDPNVSSACYEGPFPLERSATIKAVCYNEYGEGVVSEQYLLSHLGMGGKITLRTPFSNYKAIYSGGGLDALIDGRLGSNATYADGHWQGYWGDSIDAVIELPSALDRLPSRISMRFMQNTFDWVLAPTQIRVYASSDGKVWVQVADHRFDMDPRETGMRLKHYVVPLDGQLFERSAVRLIRVVVPNPGPLPSWHPAPGQPSYLFTDEIEIH